MDELRRIESEYASLGFPGAIGCSDCASREWDACRVAWKGMHIGKSRKACNRIEVVCDDYLYIWHFSFGMPGAKNDINILNSSPFFKKIRNGQWPPCRPSTNVGGLDISWYYFLVDGIYPKFRFFISNFLNPRNLKEKRFGKQKEGARKSVERVLGILFKRCGIIYRPFPMWHKSDMTIVANACVIIHNMIVSQRREKYKGTQNVRLPEDDMRIPTEVRLICGPQNLNEQAQFWREHVDGCEDIEQQMLLKRVLSDDIWAAKGGEQCVDESDGDDFDGTEADNNLD
jgi:Plant transposon protein